MIIYIPVRVQTSDDLQKVSDFCEKNNQDILPLDLLAKALTAATLNPVASKQQAVAVNETRKPVGKPDPEKGPTVTKPDVLPPAPPTPKGDADEVDIIPSVEAISEMYLTVRAESPSGLAAADEYIAGTGVSSARDLSDAQRMELARILDSFSGNPF